MWYCWIQVKFFLNSSIHSSLQSPCFTDEGTKVQGGDVTCQPHTQSRQEILPDVPGSINCVLNTIKRIWEIITFRLCGALPMAMEVTLPNSTFYNAHSNLRRLKVVITSFIGEKTQMQEGSDLPKATQMGRRLLFLSTSQATPVLPGFFPMTHILLGEVRKSRVHSPSPEVQFQLLAGSQGQETPGTGSQALWVYLVPLLSDGQRPWVRKLGFGTRPPTSESKGWQGLLSRRQDQPPPPFCVYLLNFNCELILKGKNIP